MQNHYEVLGVKVNATAAEIKKQFFELSKKYHPDRNTDADPMRYQEITQAYTVLSNDSERKKFDQQLGTEVRRPQGYHSGRSWTGREQRRPGMSGYNYNPQTQWKAEEAHSMRHSSKLDPLRPERQGKSVPHFNFARHADMHLRNDRQRQASRARSEKSPLQPTTAATASMGNDRASDPHSAGASFLVKAAGAASVGVGFIWLLLR